MAAELVGQLLQAAGFYFQSSAYAVAEAFRGLIPTALTEPGRAWFWAGQLYFELGEYELAGHAYGCAAAYDQTDASIQVRLALTCLRLGDLRNARGYLDRSLALTPVDLEVLGLIDDFHREWRAHPLVRSKGQLANPEGSPWAARCFLAQCLHALRAANRAHS